LFAVLACLIEQLFDLKITLSFFSKATDLELFEAGVVILTVSNVFPEYEIVCVIGFMRTKK
jgi:hypothetical protein